MSHVQRPQVPQQPPRHDQGFNQGSQGYNPNFTQAQNAGYDSGYSSGQVYGGPQGGGRVTVQELGPSGVIQACPAAVDRLYCTRAPKRP